MKIALYYNELRMSVTDFACCCYCCKDAGAIFLSSKLIDEFWCETNRIRNEKIASKQMAFK